jgi:hypothetical protein
MIGGRRGPSGCEALRKLDGLYASKLRGEDPLKKPTSLGLDKADDPPIPEPDEVPPGISHQEQRRQTAEMGKVPDQH